MKEYKIINQKLLTDLFSDADFVKPNKEGVYMVCILQKVNNVVREYVGYIGSAKNINLRITKEAHPYMILYRNNPELTIITRSIVTKNYIALEIELINYFKPIFNINGNKRPSGTILY